MTYSEKLKDPKWQRKRLEILQRDDFTCQCCDSKCKTLHVHHKYYLPKKDPWDYPETALVTLCFECHEQETELEPSRTLFIQSWCDAGLLNKDMDGVLHNPIRLSKNQITTLLTYLSDEDFCQELIVLIRKHINKVPKDDLEF